MSRLPKSIATAPVSAAVALLLVGCSKSPRSVPLDELGRQPVKIESKSDPEAPVKRRQPSPPEGEAIDSSAYAALARTYNKRIARLGRVWGRAVVSINYTDAQNNRHYEQGNGHFQFQSPANLALSIGKAGETLAWLGGDDSHFWVLDLQKEKMAHVGTHALVTRERAAELGIPALPLELPILLGLAPLPETPGIEKSVTMRSIDKGKKLILQFTTPQGVTCRMRLVASSAFAEKVELLDSDGVLLIESELNEYQQVNIKGEGGFFPMTASQVRITQPETEALMIMTLTDMDNRNMVAANFDFKALCELQGVVNVVNVDEEHRAPGQ